MLCLVLQRRERQGSPPSRRSIEADVRGISHRDLDDRSGVQIVGDVCRTGDMTALPLLLRAHIDDVAVGDLDGARSWYPGISSLECLGAEQQDDDDQRLQRRARSIKVLVPQSSCRRHSSSVAVREGGQ